MKGGLAYRHLCTEYFVIIMILFTKNWFLLSWRITPVRIFWEDQKPLSLELDELQSWRAWGSKDAPVKPTIAEVTFVVHMPVSETFRVWTTALKPQLPLLLLHVHATYLPQILFYCIRMKVLSPGSLYSVWTKCSAFIPGHASKRDWPRLGPTFQAVLCPDSVRLCGHEPRNQERCLESAARACVHLCVRVGFN